MPPVPSSSSRRYLSSRVLPTSAPPSFAAKSTVSLFVLISHPIIRSHLTPRGILDSRFSWQEMRFAPAILDSQTLYTHSFITLPIEQSNQTAHCLTMQSKIQNRRREALSYENLKSLHELGQVVFADFAVKARAVDAEHVGRRLFVAFGTL